MPRVQRWASFYYIPKDRVLVVTKFEIYQKLHNSVMMMRGGWGGVEESDQILLSHKSIKKQNEES
jgi:hypothetical protein